MSETGNGDAERGDATQTQGTEHIVGMVEYTTSPVHMMSASELKMENYFGYAIAIITVISVALLIVGYQMTKDVAYCPCAQISQINGTDAETCLGEKKLTEQQERECEGKWPRTGV